MHHVRRLGGVPFNKALHCANHYARRPVPHDRVVGRQKERPQDFLGLENGCGGLSYHRISPPSADAPPLPAAAFTMVAANPALRALLSAMASSRVAMAKASAPHKSARNFAVYTDPCP